MKHCYATLCAIGNHHIIYNFAGGRQNNNPLWNFLTIAEVEFVLCITINNFKIVPKQIYFISMFNWAA